MPVYQFKAALLVLLFNGVDEAGVDVQQFESGNADASEVEEQVLFDLI